MISLKHSDVVNLYQSDIAVLKDYRIMKKLTLHKSIRLAGFEVETKRGEKGKVNENKLDENIIRTRSRVFELAYCNPWELFITLTLDPDLYDRYNLKKWHKHLTHWIRDYNRKHGLKVKYLLIPEQHKDGAWHIHGFLMGLPADHLETNKNGYLDWSAYREKFGYCSIDKIRNHEAVAKYITKYISKGMSDCVKELNAHMYYCSRELQRATVIKKGTLVGANVPWDYEGDWVKCKWFSHDSQGAEALVRSL